MSKVYNSILTVIILPVLVVPREEELKHWFFPYIVLYSFVSLPTSLIMTLYTIVSLLFHRLLLLLTSIPLEKKSMTTVSKKKKPSSSINLSPYILLVIVCLLQVPTLFWDMFPRLLPFSTEFFQSYCPQTM